jgi:multiple sugar transport system substrate-binding protein
MNYRRFAPFAVKGALEPLGKYLSQSKLISSEDFYPQVMEAFTWQDELYCIPQNISSLVVYYNKKLFDEAGHTLLMIGPGMIFCKQPRV